MNNMEQRGCVFYHTTRFAVVIDRHHPSLQEDVDSTGDGSVSRASTAFSLARVRVRLSSPRRVAIPEDTVIGWYLTDIYQNTMLKSQLTFLNEMCLNQNRFLRN